MHSVGNAGVPKASLSRHLQTGVAVQRALADEAAGLSARCFCYTGKISFSTLP